jgi:hypothetical protein
MALKSAFFLRFAAFKRSSVRRTVLGAYKMRIPRRSLLRLLSKSMKKA